MTPTVILLPKGGRSPFQVYLLSLITISGIALVSGLSTNRVTESMGSPYNYFWGGFLFMGGLFSLLGIYWPRNPFTGLLIERAGLVALGGSSLIWTILVVMKTHKAGLFSGFLTFGLFLACVAQWRWVNKNVSIVVKAVHDQ